MLGGTPTGRGVEPATQARAFARSRTRDLGARPGKPSTGPRLARAGRPPAAPGTGALPSPSAGGGVRGRTVRRGAVRGPAAARVCPPLRQAPLALRSRGPAPPAQVAARPHDPSGAAPARFLRPEAPPPQVPASDDGRLPPTRPPPRLGSRGPRALPFRGALRRPLVSFQQRKPAGPRRPGERRRRRRKMPSGALWTVLGLCLLPGERGGGGAREAARFVPRGRGVGAAARGAGRGGRWRGWGPPGGWGGARGPRAGWGARG